MNSENRLPSGGIGPTPVEHASDASQTLRRQDDRFQKLAAAAPRLQKGYMETVTRYEHYLYMSYIYVCIYIYMY